MAGPKNWTDEEKVRIVQDWVDEGKPPYTAYQRRKADEAKARGESFPSTMTFCGWLNKAGVRKKDMGESKKKGSLEGLSIDASPIDKELVEFLKQYLPDEVKEDLDNSFLRWKVKRLEEEVRTLREKEQEQPKKLKEVN